MPIAGLVAAAPLRRHDRGDAVRALQLALRAHGHELVLDGHFGAITVAAVKRFQAAHGLKPDGVVGPLTGVALDRVKLAPAAAPLPSALATAPWLSVMRAISGTKEFPGGADNPIILAWVDAILARYPKLKPGIGWYKHDATPWCGLCEAYTVAISGYMPPPAPLFATNWFYDWPEGIRLKEPVLGAIGVKTRAGGGGHVFTYEGEDETFFYGRGGNQSDMVNVAPVRKEARGADKVLGFMWPKGHPLPATGGRVFTTFADAKAGSEA